MYAPRLLVITAINTALLAGFAGEVHGQVNSPTVFTYVPITPCRIVDTRVVGGPFAAKETRIYSTRGAATQGGDADCSVYPHAPIPTALSVNVTVDATSLGSPAQYGFLSFKPTPDPGNSSWMNFFGGQTIANAGVATINPVDGSFAIKSQYPANIVIDVYGYWIPSLIQTGTGGLRSTQIGMGSSASGSNSTAMGDFTQASGEDSTVMGSESTASGDTSTAMGSFTLASGNSSTAMGAYSTASGDTSTAMGKGTIASGDFSTSMGIYASTNGFSNSFVYGDGSQPGGVSTFNTADFQFMIRASGGFVFYTAGAGDTTTGVALPAGSGAWTSLSDRNAKDSVLQVDARDVLDRVVSLPLGTWHYKAQDPQYRHMGPMAQDFYAAFGLGESDKGIDTIDADGVALAAIQGLNAKLVDKDKEIEALKLRVASLESVAGDIAEMKRELAKLKHAQAPNDTVVAITSESSH